MKTTLTQGTIYLTFASLLFMVSGYVVNLWLGRSLGPADYGIYGVVISIMNMVNVMQTTGLPRAVSKLTAEDGERWLATGLYWQIVLSAFVSVGLLLGAGIIAGLLGDPQLASYIRLSALILPGYGIYGLYVGYYNGKHFFRKQALMSSAYAILKMILVIGLAREFYLRGALGGFILAPILAMGFGYKRAEGERRPHKKMLALAMPLIGFSFLMTLIMSLDLYLVKAILKNEDLVGFYTANQNIARIPYYLVSSVALVLLPSVAESIGVNDEVRTRRVVTQSIRYVLMILIPIVLILMAGSREIIQLLYSKAYLAGAESLWFLGPSMGIVSLFMILAATLNGAAKVWETMKFAGVGVIVSLVLGLWLIPSYGLVGAAVATGGGGLLAVVLSCLKIYQLFGVLIEGKQLVKMIVAGGLVYWVGVMIPTEGLGLVIEGVGLLLAYLGMLIIFREIGYSDYEFIASKWKKKK